MSNHRRYPVLHVDKVLSSAKKGDSLSNEEIRFLLQLTDKKDIHILFRAARELRQQYFDNTVFLYGFVYFSTWCRNDCSFCFYRKSNCVAIRYRKPKKEIIKIARKLSESGVHLIDLTMGEDPFYSQSSQSSLELAELVREIKRETGLPVMISPGVVPSNAMKALARAGADWYACYQETHNRVLFNRLRIQQNYDERLNRKMDARRLGLLIEEGILTGIGDRPSDIVTSIQAMRIIGAHQVRVMSFVPQRGTPLQHLSRPPLQQELIIIAVLRLLFPDRLIPASLDVEGIKGLQSRLDAGANVVTSLVPPNNGLLGVSQNSLDIEEGYRTPKGVFPILIELGLRPGTRVEYNRWMSSSRKGGNILTDFTGIRTYQERVARGQSDFVHS